MPMQLSERMGNMVYDRYAFAVPQEKQVRLITDTDAKTKPTTNLPLCRRC